MLRPEPLPPGPEQESVWDYPRPARIEPDRRWVDIVCGGRTIVDTAAALRVLETSHPPCWYVTITALRGATLLPTGRSSRCEFKGRATYHDTVDDEGRVLTAGARGPIRTPRRAMRRSPIASASIRHTWTFAWLTVNRSAAKLEDSMEGGSPTMSSDLSRANTDP